MPKMRQGAALRIDAFFSAHVWFQPEAETIKWRWHTESATLLVDLTPVKAPILAEVGIYHQSRDWACGKRSLIATISSRELSDEDIDKLRPGFQFRIIRRVAQAGAPVVLGTGVVSES